MKESRLGKIRDDKCNVSFITYKDTHEALKEIARKQERTVSNLVNLVLTEYVKNNKES